MCLPSKWLRPSVSIALLEDYPKYPTGRARKIYPVQTARNRQPAMRLPYAPSTPPDEATEECRQAYQMIAARRHPRPLIPLDLALLHAPRIAIGYSHFIGAIRTGTGLPEDVLELVLCRVAALNGAVFEWDAHSALAMEAGLSLQNLQELRDVGIGADAQSWKSMNDFQRTVLAYVDSVTRDVNVSDAAWQRLETAAGQKGWSAKELVELTVAIAAYSAVSRILVPLNVGERNGVKMEDPPVSDGKSS